MVPRAVAWTLLGGLPLGAAGALVSWAFLSPIDRRTALISAAAAFVIAEAAALYVVVRMTPLIGLAAGTVQVGHLLATASEEIPLARVTAVRVIRGSTTEMLWTRGMFGEGHIRLELGADAHRDLGWDAFGPKAARLAGALGVPLIDEQGRPVPARKIPDSVVIAMVVATVLLVALLLLGSAVVRSWR